MEKLFKTEKLIVWEACDTPNNWSKDMSLKQNLLFIQDMLRDVLNHWITKKKLNEFRQIIIDALTRCIEIDQVKILKIMLKYTGYDQVTNSSQQRNKEIFQFINIAAKYGSFDCISLLLKNPRKLDWTNYTKAECLLNAIKYNPNNMQLINFIFGKLEEIRILFVCGDIMKEVIRHDLVNIARRIIDNRWHRVNEEDELHAELINGECHKLFLAKSQALNYIDIVSQDQGDIDFNDDEWGNDQDEFDEDYDWENAED